MKSEKHHNLKLRLRNCLQTILDLEPELERLDLGHALLKEYGVLKSFIEKVDSLKLEEEDVVRIESATESFLLELRSPLSMVEDDSTPPRTVQ